MRLSDGGCWAQLRVKAPETKRPEVKPTKSVHSTHTHWRNECSPPIHSLGMISSIQRSRCGFFSQSPAILLSDLPAWHSPKTENVFIHMTCTPSKDDLCGYPTPALITSPIQGLTFCLECSQLKRKTEKSANFIHTHNAHVGQSMCIQLFFSRMVEAMKSRVCPHDQGEQSLHHLFLSVCRSGVSRKKHLITFAIIRTQFFREDRPGTGFSVCFVLFIDWLRSSSVVCFHANHHHHHHHHHSLLHSQSTICSSSVLHLFPLTAKLVHPVGCVRQAGGEEDGRIGSSRKHHPLTIWIWSSRRDRSEEEETVFFALCYGKGPWSLARNALFSALSGRQTNFKKTWFDSCKGSSWCSFWRGKWLGWWFSFTLVRNECKTSRPRLRNCVFLIKNCPIC